MNIPNILNKDFIVDIYECLKDLSLRVRDRRMVKVETSWNF